MKLKLLYFGLLSFVGLSGGVMYKAFTPTPVSKPEIIQEQAPQVESVEIEKIIKPEETVPAQRMGNTAPVQKVQPAENKTDNDSKSNYKPIDWDEVDREQERLYQEKKKQLEKTAIPLPKINATPIPKVAPYVKPKPSCSSLLADCIRQKQSQYGSGPIGAIVQYQNDCNRKISNMDCK